MQLPTDRFVDRLRDLLGMPAGVPPLAPADTPADDDQRRRLEESGIDADSDAGPPAPLPTRREQLRTRLAAGGVSLQEFDAPVSAVTSELRAGRPVVALGVDGTAYILVKRVAHLVRVEHERGVREWLDHRGIAARLGLSGPDVEHPWFAVDVPGAFELKLSHAQTAWRAVFDFVRADRADLWAIAVYAMGVGLLSLVLPLTVQVLVSTVAFGTLFQPIVVLALLLSGGLVLAAILRGLQTFMAEVIQRRLLVRVVSELASRLPRVHVTAREEQHGPELLNRFFDVFVMQKALPSLAIGGLEAFLTAFVGLLLLSFYHPLLLAFGLFIVAGVVVLLRVVGRGGTRTAIAESEAKYAIAAWLEEMSAQRITLKLAGGAEFAQRRLDTLAASWLGAREDHFRIVFRQFIGTLGLQVIASAALLGIGGWLVVERELTLGQLVAAELVVSAIVVSLSKLGVKLETAYDLAASADKLHTLLDQPLERADGASARPELGAARVELRAVSSADKQLARVSLSIAPGQRMRVNGAERGADQLVHLLFGLRAPSEGALLIDGDDLRDLSLRALRQRVAVVDGAEVLPTTIGENVAAVGRALSPREVWELLERVGLAERVRSLPDGLQTTLTHAGMPLTRTDSLLLTVARALAVRPGLLVLDRTLDALPAAQGRALLNALGREQTLLLITHSETFDTQMDEYLTLKEESQ